MAAYDALELQIIDEKYAQYIRIPEGASVDAELSDFLSQTEAYASGWVKVYGGGDEKYFRYDRIVSVTVRAHRDEFASVSRSRAAAHHRLRGFESLLAASWGGSRWTTRVGSSGYRR